MRTNEAKWKKKKVNAYPQKSLRGSSRSRGVNHEAFMGLDDKCNERDITDKHDHYQEVLLRPG
jgi:hypothetical protein